MKKDSKIFVAGHKGMVGSAIVRKLEAEGYTNITTACHNFGVKQYINLGSSCIYPMNAHIPIQEHALFKTCI